MLIPCRDRYSPSRCSHRARRVAFCSSVSFPVVRDATRAFCVVSDHLMPGKNAQRHLLEGRFSLAQHSFVLSCERNGELTQRRRTVGIE
jgi:hypothetical protein